MARLQILELPEGSGDERPPFVLVIDQMPTEEAAFNALRRDLTDAAQRIGARAVLGFDTTIDIPANDTTAYLTATAGGSLPADAHYETVIDGKPIEWTHVDEANARATEGLRLAHERTDIARDMDRLAKRKNELADALGMDHASSWDDIRNTAAEFRTELVRSENAREHLRQDRDAQAAEIERLRAGAEPVTDERIAPTPAQWIWHWNQATPEKRLSMAAQIQDGMARSNNCLLNDHEAQIERLRVEAERLREEPAAHRQHTADSQTGAERDRDFMVGSGATDQYSLPTDAPDSDA